MHIPIMKPVIAGGTTLKNGLVSVWELNETSGTTAYDAFGSNDGTNNGADINQSGITNLPKSYYFDGGTDDIDYGNVIDFDYNEPFSLSCWVKRGDIASHTYLIFKMENSVNYRGYDMYIKGTSYGNYFAFELRSTISNALIIHSASAFTSTNLWYHCVITYDGSATSGGVKLYVNNTLQTNVIDKNTLSATTLNSASLNIGSRDGLAYSLFGNIIQGSIWNRALTPAEITTLYNSGNGLAYINW